MEELRVGRVPRFSALRLLWTIRSISKAAALREESRADMRGVALMKLCHQRGRRGGGGTHRAHRARRRGHAGQQARSGLVRRPGGPDLATQMIAGEAINVLVAQGAALFAAGGRV